MLELISRVMVCLETVCIHAPEGPAVASRLFGMLGWERFTLVDALDYDRLNKLWALWATYRKNAQTP